MTNTDWLDRMEYEMQCDELRKAKLEDMLRPTMTDAEFDSSLQAVLEDTQKAEGK